MEWIKIQDPSICCLQETRFRPKATCRQKNKGQRNICHANGCQKKARLAILISDKIDFQTKSVTRDKEGHYILIKGKIQQEDIITVNVYVPSMRVPKHSKTLVCKHNSF